MDQTSIRQLTADDLEFADGLRELAGWNQTARDWQRFLTLEPQGCFLATRNGAPAGTATCTSYGRVLAWIGMVLVHPDHRRHGIGSALLRHCLQHLDAQGVRTIKLDATPLGRPLYERLGFQGEGSLTRWQTPALPLVSPITTSGLRPCSRLDLPEIVSLDEEAFGCSRERLLSELLMQSTGAVLKKVGPALSGFGFLRAGSRAFYLGPVVAKSASAAGELIRNLIGPIRGQPLFWDLPDDNDAARAIVPELGLKAQRHLLRMCRGENVARGRLGWQFGIIDPAVG